MFACAKQLLCRAGASSSTAKADSLMVAEPNLTRIMFEAVDARAAGGQAQAGGAGGRTTYQALLAADQAWSNLRNMEVGNCPPCICIPLAVVLSLSMVHVQYAEARMAPWLVLQQLHHVYVTLSKEECRR
jgi:hypothetical protein